MGYRCDSCHGSIQPDENGFFVGKDGTSDCPMSDGGHTWEGKEGIK
ncbi:hypothetical protein SEA_JUANYO_62 [Microbacterium phage Juanyo]|nr:hypothetical protein SEA_JUANYO_62 [Microbacterium phage Juanyo]